MEGPFWRGGIRFRCQRSGCCCETRDGYGYIYLNRRDRARLAAHLGITEAALIATYCTETDGFVHLRDPEHDCRFFVERRCSVYEARPDQCRTWPFWEENLSSPEVWAREVAAICPGAGQGCLVPADEIARCVALAHRTDEEAEEAARHLALASGSD